MSIENIGLGFACNCNGGEQVNLSAWQPYQELTEYAEHTNTEYRLKNEIYRQFSGESAEWRCDFCCKPAVIFLAHYTRVKSDLSIICDGIVTALTS